VSPSGERAWVMPSAAQAPCVRRGVPNIESGAEAPQERWVCPTHRPAA